MRVGRKEGGARPAREEGEMFRAISILGKSLKGAQGGEGIGEKVGKFDQLGGEGRKISGGKWRVAHHR